MKAKHCVFDDGGNDIINRKVDFWYVGKMKEHGVPEGLCISLYSTDDLNYDGTNEEIYIPLKAIKKSLKGKGYELRRI